MHLKLKKSLHLSKLLLLITTVIAGSCVSRQMTTTSQGNDGDVILKSKCLVCHEADLIQQQRLSKPAWTKEVEKMMRWGAVINDAEKELLIAFLSASFGPRPILHGAQTSPTPAPTSASIEKGKKIYEAKCLLCHEKDLVLQQRLSRAGWTREVEKMTRWGATVEDAEKEVLVDYLITNPSPTAK